MSTLHSTVVEKINASVSQATLAHFQDTLKISILTIKVTNGIINELKLKDMTAIIGISGKFGALIAFSFNAELANHILDIETTDLVMSDEEYSDYRLDVIAETINIVLGHSTKALSKIGEPVGLTPPIVLEDGGLLRRPRGALFSSFSYKTTHGLMDIVFITPSELYGDNLSLVKNSGDINE